MKKLCFTLVLLFVATLTTGGCAAKIGLSDLRHFAEGFRRAPKKMKSADAG